MTPPAIEVPSGSMTIPTSLIQPTSWSAPPRSANELSTWPRAGPRFASFRSWASAVCSATPAPWTSTSAAVSAGSSGAIVLACARGRRVSEPPAEVGRDGDALVRLGRRSRPLEPGIARHRSVGRRDDDERADVPHRWSHGTRSRRCRDRHGARWRATGKQRAGEPWSDLGRVVDLAVRGRPHQALERLIDLRGERRLILEAGEVGEQVADLL